MPAGPPDDIAANLAQVIRRCRKMGWTHQRLAEFLVHLWRTERAAEAEERLRTLVGKGEHEELTADEEAALEQARERALRKLAG